MRFVFAKSPERGFGEEQGLYRGPEAEFQVLAYSAPHSLVSEERPVRRSEFVLKEEQPAGAILAYETMTGRK
ncbi:hypothetical protein AOG23_28685 [Rhizobium acidisoli]|nr:hypothetical protein AOG23_28685 [Rhizobium acidisoli]